MSKPDDRNISKDEFNKIIEKAQQYNQTVLDLSLSNIFEIPNQIGVLNNLAELDLENNSISSIPPEIGNLKSLRKLVLSANYLSRLPSEITKLEKLESLHLRDNFQLELESFLFSLLSLKKLDLQSINLSDLPDAIGNLSHLEHLWLSNNHIVNLPETIGQLIMLKELTAWNNKITKLPDSFENLQSLEELSLGTYTSSKDSFSITEPFNDVITSYASFSSGNNLNEFPRVLTHLTKLRKLDLSGNHIKEIPPLISNLVELEELHLAQNGISNLPAGLLSLKKLLILDLRENPLDIPPELLEKIEEPHVLLSYYFTNNKKPLFESKIIFVGQGSVGKTSLIKKLIHNSFDKNESKTDGISINHWQVTNELDNVHHELKINLNIWDFGGQEIMHATHQFFLTKRSLYLLVLDSRLTQEENRVEYWLKIIQSFGGESPVLIIGNKIDQHPLDIDRTGLQKKYPNIVGIFETSAATGAGIKELKAAITERVSNLPHVRDLLPETWFTVKTKLEGLGRESNFITHDKYLELCAENEVSDETSQRTLIGFLHDLGVVLHFQDDPRLEVLGILNPQWVTNGVYKILNSKALFQNKGVLTVAMLDEILNLPEYPRGKRLFIVDMMKKFELCYDLEPDKTFLVPDLLPKDEPAELKFNGVPAFEYAYPVLPSSVITRFIVRMNQKIENHFVWRTGVVLKIGENKALVKADIEDRKITIAIDGLEHTRRDALSAIRYQLDEIHGSIKGLDAQKRVPVPNAAHAEPLKYEYLLKLERSGQEFLPVENGNDLVTVNVRQMLSAIETEAQRRETRENVTQIFVGGNFGGNLTVGDIKTSGGDFSGRDKTISANEKLPHQNPTSRHENEQESIEQKRALDAAIAKHIPVGKPTELITLVRMLDSDGLRAILQIEFEDLNLSSEDVISKSFSIDFPVDSSGKPLPAGIIMEIEAPDFEPKMIHKSIRIPPYGDAEPVTCLLTPLCAGDLRVNISLYKEELFIASRVLKTRGEETPQKDKTSPYVLVTIPLNLISIENYISTGNISHSGVNIAGADINRENINTNGGTYIGGNINTNGGDFVGRDKSISASGGSVIVGRDLSGNVISGDNNQIIQDSYNKIKYADIAPELKETMKQLAEAVNAMIQKLPAEQAAEAAEDFGKLADEAVKSKPNQKWYSVSIEGLIKAAENLDKLGEPVINLSRKVLSLLMRG
jgi:internalin A